jgi:hypothetical protein
MEKQMTERYFIGQQILLLGTCSSTVRTYAYTVRLYLPSAYIKRWQGV